MLAMSNSKDSKLKPQPQEKSNSTSRPGSMSPLTVLNMMKPTNSCTKADMVKPILHCRFVFVPSQQQAQAWALAVERAQITKTREMMCNVWLGLHMPHTAASSLYSQASSQLVEDVPSNQSQLYSVSPWLMYTLYIKLHPPLPPSNSWRNHTPMVASSIVMIRRLATAICPMTGHVPCLHICYDTRLVPSSI
eukprot:4601639-Amphidinium_carterae.1